MAVNNTKYIYAVSHIRANENALLTSSDLDQLVSADSMDNALRILSDKGFSDITDNSYEISLKNKQLETWELVNSVMPKENMLDFMLVKNDYHNIKAVLKAVISQRTTDSSIIEPTTVDADAIKSALQSGDYSDLPEYLENDLKEAYELAVRTNDGQFTDATLDRKAYERMNLLAKDTEDDFIISFVEKLIAIANIKIAIRGARTNRDSAFYDCALIECDTLSVKELKDTALKGEKEVIEYLLSTEYRESVDFIKDSNSAFEKWCDDYVMNSLEEGKTENFGIAPVIAYYYAKETEIRNIRIILSCIYNELPKEKIIERMRKLYV